MLMASQSPPLPPSPPIQTLPSDQQQQQQRSEGATYTQKDSTNSRLRREKSMEFDDDIRINDDINNNTATYQATNSPATSSVDEDQQLVISAPSPSRTSSPTIDLPMEEASSLSSIRRSIRPSISRRSFGSNDQSSTIIEPDPNVFLISSDTNSHNTIRKTKHDVKRFVMYIDEQFGEKQSLHTISAESLCRYLKHYFENTKKFDGTQYEPDTLRSFLLSIERYLKSKHYEYNLMESHLFQACRQVIITKREQWRKMGGNNNNQNNNNNNNSNHTNSNTKQTITVLDTKNLTVFDRSKPDGLLLEIYVHLSKLGQDHLSMSSQLLWRDVELVDEQYLVCHQRKHENQLARLYATPTQLSTCPVQAYRLYATHRPPQCNTPQSPFYLTPRASSIHHTWYKTSAAGKNLEQILQRALQRACQEKRTSPIPVANLKPIDTLQSSSSSSLSDFVSFSTATPLTTGGGVGLLLNSKRNELRTSPLAKRTPECFHMPLSLLQPLNLSVATTSATVEDDSGTASSSPTNSLSNEIAVPPPIVGKSSPLLNGLLVKQQSSPSPPSHVPVWDESVTEILLTVAKQRDTRVTKINILRTYLEEKLGVVEFLCLYRGFKSEPKLTFHGTPWEHYQRFLPVLFTLLTLDNTTL